MNNYWVKFGLTAATTTVAYSWWKERTHHSIASHLEPVRVLPELIPVVSVVDVAAFEPPSSDVVADVAIPIELPSPFVAVVEVVHLSAASLELPTCSDTEELFNGTYSRRQLILEIKERGRLGFKDSFTISLRYFTEIGCLFLVVKYVGNVYEAAIVTEETGVIPFTVILLKVMFAGIIAGASFTHVALSK